MFDLFDQFFCVFVYAPENAHHDVTLTLTKRGRVWVARRVVRPKNPRYLHQVPQDLLTGGREERRLVVLVPRDLIPETVCELFDSLGRGTHDIPSPFFWAIETSLAALAA